MALGLARDVVELAMHDPSWKGAAAEAVARLWRVFGSAAKDIQHVGSTAVENIMAKPIVDIAVAVDSFAEVEALEPALEAEGFLRRDWETGEQMLFAAGDYSKPGGVVTHFVHVVETGGAAWRDYVNFRDYLNANPAVGRDYEKLKTRLARENPADKGREKYLAGKHRFIAQALEDALAWRAGSLAPKRAGAQGEG